MADQEIRNRLVEKMLRKRIVGGKNRTVDAVVNMALPSHQQGAGRDAIDEMVRAGKPIEQYGGQRDAIRLTSVEDAVEYLEENDGNVPFGFGS